MINKLLAGIIVSVSVIELNCCSCCNNDKANDDYEKNPKPKPKHNPKPITPTIPEFEPEVNHEPEHEPEVNPKPKANPIDFKSIKIQKCIMTGIEEEFDCVENTELASSNEQYTFKDVIDDITVYGHSVRLFRVSYGNDYLLVFTEDIKNKIEDKEEILSKVYTITKGVYLLFIYCDGGDNYGVISRVAKDDEDQNLLSVECNKV